VLSLSKSNTETEAVVSGILDGFSNVAKKAIFGSGSKYAYRIDRAERVLKLIGEIRLDEAFTPLTEFFASYWESYASKELAVVLRQFPAVERALYGLETTLEGNRRYRDHYIHSFCNFMFGCQILAASLDSAEQPVQKETLSRGWKVEDEPESIPFRSGQLYSGFERVFFLWKLMTHFQDIGVPGEHHRHITHYLSEFFGRLGFRLGNEALQTDDYVQAQLPYYAQCLACLHRSGIRNENGLYARSTERDETLYRAALVSFDHRHHAAIGAVCLLRWLEHRFQEQDPEANYRGPELYADYIRNVLECDITRASLCILLHGLDHERFPNLYPVDFDRLPLTWLAILCDELQEFLRPEGIDLRLIAPVLGWPQIEKASFDLQAQLFAVGVRLSCGYLETEDLRSVLRQRQAHLLSSSRPLPWGDPIGDWRKPKQRELRAMYKKYMADLWGSRTERLEQRLRFGGSRMAESGFSVTLKLEVRFGTESHSWSFPSG
jgi:hypothetical protein